MNHDHDELFSPSAKAKAIGTIWSSGSTAATIIKVPLCNTPGVYHQLSGGFNLKHDRLNGDETNLKLDVASLLYI
jgi:hypothetical protein